jgi:hypothetical protein
VPAFVLEATFLGLWVFGWNHLSAGLHLAMIWIVALATWLSAYLIVVAISRPPTSESGHNPVSHNMPFSVTGSSSLTSAVQKQVSLNLTTYSGESAAKTAMSEVATLVAFAAPTPLLNRTAVAARAHRSRFERPSESSRQTTEPAEEVDPLGSSPTRSPGRAGVVTKAIARADGGAELEITRQEAQSCPMRATLLFGAEAAV